MSTDGTDTNRALSVYNTMVSPEHVVSATTTEVLKQQALSKQIDDRALARLGDPASASLAFQAHLSLVSAPDAGRWLHAVPAKDSDSKVSAELFVLMLKRRLRTPVFESEMFCPLCDDVMDVYGDHALVCCGGGDRTKRHNLIRNCAHELCSLTGLSSELERPGLLRPRPLMEGVAEDGVQFDGPNTESGRRPADVYVPRWFRGVPACLDFAVTSGLRSAHLRSSARDASAAVLSYEGYKCSYLNTQAHCRAEGMAFIPMIVEGHGGSWGPEAAKCWSKLAKSHALSSGELRATVLSRFLSALSIIVHRENARAILRRSHSDARPSSIGTGVGAAAAILTADAA